MLGFFPDPYPNELLYSVFARYHARAGYKSKLYTMRDFYDYVYAEIPYDFPCRMNLMISRLPRGHSYTADQIIDQNTLFPFYAPFMVKEKAADARQIMHGLESSKIFGVMGVLTAKVKLERLRYCPACLAEDRRIFGESFWKRTHQIVGILVCPVHQVFLKDSSVIVRKSEKQIKLITADRAELNLDGEALDVNCFEHQVLLRLAKEAHWLSQQQMLNEDAALINRRYRNALFNLYLSTIGGVISLTKLQEQFRRAFSPELLRKLNCELASGGENWLVRIFQSPRTAQHPVRHFLLMQFLNLTMDEFLKLPLELEPFGAAPFPCFNPVSAHYGELRINNVNIRHKQKSEKDLAGTFTCQECEFTYRKFTVDGKMQKSNFDKIVKFGKVWDAALCENFARDENITPELAEKFGVSMHILTRQAVRLNLTNKYQYLMPKKAAAGITLAEYEEQRVSFRKLWLETIAAYPELGRGELRWKAEWAYVWLRRHDSDWFEENSPPIKKTRAGKRLYDWETLDAELAAKVAALALTLKTEPGKPIHVTQTTLMRRLKIVAFVKYPQRIPLTIVALKENCESFMQYYLRRIEYVANLCLAEKNIPPKSRFFALTGISSTAFKRNFDLQQIFNETYLRVAGRVRETL